MTDLAAGCFADPRTGVVQYDFTFQGERYRGTTKTKDAARAGEFVAKLRAQLYDEKRLGVKVATAERTLAEAFSAYTAGVIVPNQPANMRQTTKATKSVVRRLLKDFGASTPLSAVFAAIPAWKAAQVAPLSDAEALARSRRVLSRATVNRRLGALLACLHHSGFDTVAAGARLVQGNMAADAARKYAKVAARVRWLLEDERPRLFAALAEDPELRDLVVFLLDVGARRAEALSLTWADVLLDREPRPAVILHDSKDPEAKPRTVALSHRAEAVLRRRFARRLSPFVFPWDAESLAIRGEHRSTKGRKTEGYITPAHERPPGVYVAKAQAGKWHAVIKVRGVKMHLGTYASEADAIDARRCAETDHFSALPPEVPDLRRGWARVVKAARLVDFDLRDCRHDFATRLVRAGQPLKVVATLLGHTTTAMVDRVYGHLAPAQSDAAIAAIDNAGDEAPIVVLGADEAA